tara:strand:+ start:918 stop:1166 length:249 start_codon:yes stop_codon:yes gene_type:complete
MSVAHVVNNYQNLKIIWALYLDSVILSFDIRQPHPIGLAVPGYLLKQGSELLTIRDFKLIHPCAMISKQMGIGVTDLLISIF